jgi:hypothetical protein
MITDERIRDILARCTVDGKHTSGGDGKLPAKDRGFCPIDGVPDETIGVQQVRDAISRVVVDGRDDDRDILDAIEAAYDVAWLDFCAREHPDWVRSAVDDVCFTASLSNT